MKGQEVRWKNKCMDHGTCQAKLLPPHHGHPDYKCGEEAREQARACTRTVTQLLSIVLWGLEGCGRQRC